ncbi:MAG: Gfo/Idh/MocA family oxidoreductase, partial [Cyclobacteriaceae bacterium]
MNSTRRTFLKTTAAATLGASLLPSLGFASSSDEKLRLGFIGVGLRGQNHLELALSRKDVDVVAICDVQQRMIDMSLGLVATAGKPKPHVILDGPNGYKKLLDRKDIDAVIIATPWEWHTVMCLDAMNAKKYVGCEVITGMTVEECWQLVNTSEKTGMPLMMLENVCYRRDVMAVMNMVRQNMFGELIHLQGGYQHDLREVKFNDGISPYGGGVEFGEKGFSEAQWRTQHSVDRNGDLYPTHGIGPIAMMTNINRGNRFTKLVS